MPDLVSVKLEIVAAITFIALNQLSLDINILDF